MADYDPDRLMTEPPPAGGATMRVRPRRKTEETSDHGYSPAISDAMAQILDKIKGGESGGRYNIKYGGGTFDPDKGHPREAVPITEGPNKGKTSSAAGAYQFIGSTWDKVAAKTGRTDMSKESQDINAAQLAKDTYRRQTGRDIEADWSTPSLRQGIEHALGSEWESLAKPGPRVDKLGPDGQPRYRFSDYAMGEHADRPNTDVRWMSPEQYLDLTPPLEGKPFESPSGRSLKKSFDRGEPMESMPSLDVNVDGSTAKVTDQDGRHRALLAQQEGVDAIPVAIKRTGEGEPTEIEGMSGNKMPHDFPKAPPRQARQEPQQQQREPLSLMGQVGSALMPSAEAAEPANPYAEFKPPAAAQPAAANPYAEFKPPEQAAAEGGATQGEPDGMLMSGLKGAAKGFGETMLGGQELVGKGMEAVGIPGGQWLTQDARAGVQKLEGETAADQTAHPYATGIGDFLGGMAIPGGIAGKLVKPANALRGAAAAGGIAGALTPGGGDENFWSNKAIGTGAGAAGGVAAGAAGNALSKMVAPSLRATVGKLMGEGVQLTPGQMAGGYAKRAEDVMASIPLLGAQVRKAQRRSIETFNRAAINRSLDDLGAKLPDGLDSGHEAIGKAQDMFSHAYDQVIPMMAGRVDPAFQTGLNDVMTTAAAQNLPKAYQEQLEHVIRQEVIEPFRLGGGSISGTDTQKIGTKLDELINPLKRGGVYEQQLGGYLREADKHLDDMMRRQNPLLQAAKDRIDAGYAKFKTVQHAGATINGAHADGTFTPAQLNRAVHARDKSKDKGDFARGDAMMQDLATAARDVLPQVVNDSGTPERALLMGALLGAGHFEPHSAALLAGLAVPYTVPASKAINAAMNRLAQQPGPTRNALAMLAQHLGQAAAPGAGSAAASAAPQLLGN